ncbi:MAG: proton-conducting transporter membrane subunit [Rhodocyclaceae bacterium]|nr:proton-conducting transporter membrane subunit [Rhodocyclaceae bacterium]
MADPLVGLVLLPLGWATLAFVLGPGRGAWAALAGIAAQAWLAWLLAAQVGAGGTARHAVGGWGAPLGIDLAADGLSAALLLLTQWLALGVALYARSYFAAGDPARRYFWPLAGFLLAGLNALFVANDLFNLYVTLELVGLAAVGLVAAAGGERQIAAALRYLFAALAGSGLYLFGVALVYGVYGTVSIATLAPLITPEAPRLVWIAGGLMALGLVVKSALFPFHFWLPPAHGGAPAPVSALLSALVVKASFYLLLRLWLGPFAPLAPAAAWLPALLGAAAIFWGSWRAIRAERLKPLIAWSTVAQLGYLFLIFPLLAVPAAFGAGVMQVFAHALAKAALFAAAGVFIQATGQDTVAGLAGAAARLPVTLFAIGLAGMTLAGLPPSAGFLAKWQLIEAALALGHWPIAVVALAGGLMAAVYVFRVLRQAFCLAPAGAPVAAVPRALEWTAFALAAASVLLGFFGVDLMTLIEVRA